MKLFGFLFLIAALQSPAIAQDEHYFQGPTGLFNAKFDITKLGAAHCKEAVESTPVRVNSGQRYSQQAAAIFGVGAGNFAN
jgi:hypothetical protein